MRKNSLSILLAVVIGLFLTTSGYAQTNKNLSSQKERKHIFINF
jgi:hypothetical protein